MAKLTHINPDGVPPYLQYGLSHAVVAEGSRTVYASGQVGWDENGVAPGPDLKSQLAQAHENVRRVLAASGATVADIVRITTYVANYEDSDGAIVNEANLALFAGITPPSANLIGVQSLYTKEIRCEVEVTAVIG